MEKNVDYTEQLLPKLFNTPLEIGLRCLMILKQIGEQGADNDKLMFFDYLALNTADIGGPESLHAPIPNRGIQVYARKNLIQKGITILVSKELINIEMSNEGFLYKINESGNIFLSYFNSDYFYELEKRVTWIVAKFEKNTTNEIRKFINENFQSWSGEFLLSNQS